MHSILHRLTSFLLQTIDWKNTWLLLLKKKNSTRRIDIYFVK
jgi:hypothetical protein